MARRERVWLVVAHVPALVIAWTNAMFIYNHFYWKAPYLHDSGWFSALVYRNGFFPKSPHSVAHQYVDYWGWHPSILLSAGSLLSYLFPGGRIEWYAIFQAAIYAPLAIALPLLVPKHARTSVSSACLTAIASLAFAFGGQVVICISFPHFEILSSAGCAIMLASLATERKRLAWIGLVMSVVTREDGGLHAATFLAAVFACDLTGRAFPVDRRRVLRMIAVGLASSVVLIIVQKKLFLAVDAWKLYLAGDPPYAHVTKALVAERLSNFWERCGFIWMPFVGSVVIAVVRRDARYLLGWLVTTPWLLLNFFALQPEKGHFVVYTGFPFIGSVFWVGAYATGADRRPVLTGWRWPLVAVAALSTVSLFGFDRGSPYTFDILMTQMVYPRGENVDGLRELARQLRARKHGRVLVDPSVASLAVEDVRRDDLVISTLSDEGFLDADAFAFYARGESVTAQLESPFTKCGRVPRTATFFCTRPDRTLSSSVVPASPLFWTLSLVGSHARRTGDTIVVDAAPLDLVNIGPSVKLQPGRYRVTWRIRFRDCAPDTPMPHLIADVVHVSIPFAVGVSASRPFSVNEGAVAHEFVVTPELKDDVWDFRNFTGNCAFELDGIDLAKSGL